MRFLRMAKGSCGELRTQRYIGNRIGSIQPAHGKRLIAEAWQLSRMLHGLIESVSRADADAGSRHLYLAS
ncbi:four helix bundle protein [Thiohalobacter sp.]|uniref:four helix bundle protein n=1 Tax=Thiohalobacter sp. TaxID=2025948 RepID=UPI00260FA664|nr:four helix bundle protein [Thiohalobacter sp.]